MHGKMLIVFFAVLLFCSLLYGATEVKTLDMGDGLHGVELSTFDVTTGYDDNYVYYISISFTPNTPSNICSILLKRANLDTHIMKDVTFDDRVCTLVMITEDEVFQGEYQKILCPIVGPNKNWMALIGADSDYFESLLKRNKGNSDILIRSTDTGENYFISLDYDPVEFYRKLESCRTSNEQALLNW